MLGSGDSLCIALNFRWILTNFLKFCQNFHRLLMSTIRFIRSLANRIFQPCRRRSARRAAAAAPRRPRVSRPRHSRGLGQGHASPAFSSERSNRIPEVQFWIRVRSDSERLSVFNHHDESSANARHMGKIGRPSKRIPVWLVVFVCHLAGCAARQI